MKEWLALGWLAPHLVLAWVFFPWSQWILPLFRHRHKPAKRWLTYIEDDGSGHIFGRCEFWCFASMARHYHEPDAFRRHDGSGSWWKVIDHR